VLRLSAVKGTLDPSERAALNSELNVLRAKHKTYAVHQKQWKGHVAISALPLICNCRDNALELTGKSKI